MSNDETTVGEMNCIDAHSRAGMTRAIDQFPRMTTSSLDNGSMDQRAGIEHRENVARDAIVPSTKMTSRQFSGCHVFVK